MDNKIKKVEAERTKFGWGLCEWGGSEEKEGLAEIICDEYGEKLPAFCVFTGGDLTCRRHALILVSKGYYVIRAYHKQCDFTITVYKVRSCYWTGGKDFVELEEIAKFKKGKWDNPEIKLDFLQNAIEAAKKKAMCYHCDSPHFFNDKRKG